MPTWVLIVTSVALVVITLVGLLNFPYAPMFFGVNEGNRNTLRARLIVRLLQVFPLVTLLSIIAAWAANPAAVFIPIVCTIIIWAFRVKASRSERPSSKATLEEVVQEKLKELDYEWGDKESVGTSAYILFTVSLHDAECISSLTRKIEQEESLVQALSVNQSETPAILEVRIATAAANRGDAIALTQRFIRTVWPFSAVVTSLSIMDESI